MTSHLQTTSPSPFLTGRCMLSALPSKSSTSMWYNCLDMCTNCGAIKSRFSFITSSSLWWATAVIASAICSFMAAMYAIILKLQIGNCASPPLKL